MKKPLKTTKDTKPRAPATTSYISADIAMLAHVTPEKRAALEKMYATSHMAIPNFDKR